MKKIVQIVAIQFSQRLKIYKNTPNIQVCIFWSSSDMQIFAGVLLLSKEQWWQFRCYHVTVLQLWLKWKLTWQCFSSCGSVDCIPAPGPSRKNIQQKAFFMHILLLDWIITIAMMRNASGLQIHCQSWRVFSFLMKIASRNSNEKKECCPFPHPFLLKIIPFSNSWKTSWYYLEVTKELIGYDDVRGNPNFSSQHPWCLQWKPVSGCLSIFHGTFFPPYPSQENTERHRGCSISWLMSVYVIYIHWYKPRTVSRVSSSSSTPWFSITLCSGACSGQLLD